MKNSDLPQNILGPAGSWACDTAYVVFSNAARIKCLQVLKPGFRHCFLVLPCGDHGWVTLDPLAHHLDIMMHDLPPALPLIDFFKNAGMTIVKVRKRAPYLGFSGPFSGTCVGVIKRYLGIYAPLCLTPFALYTRLIKDGAERITAPPPSPAPSFLSRFISCL